MKDAKDWVKISPILQADKQATDDELAELIRGVQIDALWEAREQCEGQSWLRVSQLLTDLRKQPFWTDIPEIEKKSCPTTGQNEKPLALFKVTLRQALFHSSSDKQLLGTFTVRQHSQENIEVEVVQLTELGRLASPEQVDLWSDFAGHCCKTFEPQYPIRWSEDLAVEALIEHL